MRLRIGQSRMAEAPGVEARAHSHSYIPRFDTLPRSRRRFGSDGRLPGSRLSPRSVPDRRMMGIRGISLPMLNAPSKVAGGNSQRGMASPTSPAGTSRLSERTDHGDIRSLHGSPPKAKEPHGDGPQAAVDVAASGSKSAPVFHIACMTTAILRARATAARLKPRRFLRVRPQRRSRLSLRTRVSSPVEAS